MKVRVEFDIDAAEAPRVTPLLHAFQHLVDSLNRVHVSPPQASTASPSPRRASDAPASPSQNASPSQSASPPQQRAPQAATSAASEPRVSEPKPSPSPSPSHEAASPSTTLPRARPHRSNGAARARTKKRQPALDTCERVFDAVAQARVSVKRAAALLRQMLHRTHAAVLDDDIIAAAATELLDPTKVCNHPSRAANIVLTVAAMGQPILHTFRTRFMADVVEQLSKPRHIRCDRAQFLGYSEGLATMVNARIIPADNAIEMVQNLLRTGQSCTAAVSTLCRIADTCEQSIDALVEHRHMLEGVKSLLANVATIPEYAYDIQYLNGVTGWAIPLSPTAQAKQL